MIESNYATIDLTRIRCPLCCQYMTNLVARESRERPFWSSIQLMGEAFTMAIPPMQLDLLGECPRHGLQRTRNRREP